MFTLDRRKWLGWVRDILIVLLIAAAVQWWQSRSLTHGQAPALAGPALKHGAMLSLATYRGRPVLVHFWATWCPVCRLEQGNIASLARTWPVLTVATNSGDAKTIRHYMQKHDLHFPVLVDSSGALARRWGVVGVPATFVVDGKGVISYAGQGYSSGIGLRLRLWLAD